MGMLGAGLVGFLLMCFITAVYYDMEGVSPSFIVVLLFNVIMLLSYIAVIRMRFVVSEKDFAVVNTALNLFDTKFPWHRVVLYKRDWMIFFWLYSLDYITPDGFQKGVIFFCLKDQWKLSYEISRRVKKGVVEK
jgi:hypothetical protein